MFWRPTLGWILFLDLMIFNLGLDLISEIHQNTPVCCVFGLVGGWVGFIVLPTKHARSINGKSQHKNTPGKEQTTVRLFKMRRYDNRYSCLLMLKDNTDGQNMLSVERKVA